MGLNVHRQAGEVIPQYVKTLYASPRDMESCQQPRQNAVHTRRRGRRSGIQSGNTEQVGTKYENDTYDFDLQGVNFSLDSLLLFVVRSLVGFASTILNERDCRSRGSRRGRWGRFRGSRGIVSVGGGRFWFFGLRILGGSSFGFGGGSHGRGDQRRGEDVGPLYTGTLYVRACDVEEYEVRYDYT